MNRLLNFHPSYCLGLASAGALALMSACGSNEAALTKPPISAEIRRTSFGIVHVKADDEAGIGYGIGHAYAEDNFCLLANEVVTVNGERSKYFGAEGVTSQLPMLKKDNLTSDYFFRLVNDDATIDAAWQGQSAAVQSLVKGYVAGVNRYLDKTGAASLPDACRNAAWVRPITERDVVKLIRRVAMSNSSLVFMDGMVGANSPQPGWPRPQAATQSQAAAKTRAASRTLADLLRRTTASNAVALGRNATDNGRGMLLGQPHLPWGDSFRFYQLHLTIPGKLDVMGASLPGLPIVGIGFTKNLAWSHTTDTSAHYTLYALKLDSNDPTRYVVDGQSHAMTRKTVSLEVKDEDGRITTESRDFYHTRFGPAVIVPEAGLNWTGASAYALRDANADNHRALEQWYAMNRATSLDELKAVNERIVGNPWNNTIAADKDGNTLYFNISPIPNLPEAKLASCVAEPHRELAASGLFVLAGDTANCDWVDDPTAPQAGIVAGYRLPALRRTDYVHNANDSAWLSNPAAPLTGFSPLVSMDGVAQGGRTRSGLAQLQARLAGTDGLGGNRMSLPMLQGLALNNRVHLAQLVMDDVLQLCQGQKTATAGDGTQVDLSAACATLASWDRTANLDTNMGYLYFAGMMSRVIGREAVWARAFDPADPLNTPRGLRHSDASVAAVLREALASAVRDVSAMGWSSDARLRDIQVARRGGRTIPIHGGSEYLGIYNAIAAEPGNSGLLDVVAGTTYVQAVAFDEEGPRVQSLLTYSQSDDPKSPHHADQTERFSRKEWVTLPFSETQIRADSNYRTVLVSE